MNCKNCYQEIPDGSKFCPHCGAKQNEVQANEVQANEVQPNAEQENAVKNDPVQATGAAKTTENAAGYQDVSGYQNNSGYQNVTGYQNNGQKPEINYVPYLILSIISTVCCCLPFGIVGIVFSVKINSAMNAGNYEEAVQDAKMAKIWTIVSFVVGLLFGIVYFVLGIMAGIDTYY